MRLAGRVRTVQPLPSQYRMVVGMPGFAGAGSVYQPSAVSVVSVMARKRKDHGPRLSGFCQRLPRLSCSRSIASNSALKLPLPKPSEPCRSISSKNTVGRSPSGLVKICSR